MSKVNSSFAKREEFQVLMKRITRAISWLTSVLLLAGAMAGSVGNIAIAANPNTIGPSGFEPTVTSQTIDTPYATPVSIAPRFTSDGINLQFCLVEAKGNNCAANKKPNLKAEVLTVRGEGTWTLEPANGVLTFAPLPDFSGLTTPVTLQANDSFGSGSGKILVKVGNPSAPSISTTIAATIFDTPITVLPQASGALMVASTACLVTETDCVKILTTDEGRWEINIRDGSVTFTPLNGFAGTASISYQIADSFGQAVTGQIVIGVGNPAPPVVSDVVKETDYNIPVTFKLDIKGKGVVKNKVCFVDPVTTLCAAGEPLFVEGEGTWSVITAGSQPLVTFTPLPTFAGDATPVEVRIADSYRANGGKCKNPESCYSQTGSSKMRVRVKNPTQDLTAEFIYAETSFNTPISFNPEIQNAVDGTKLDYCVIDPYDSQCKTRVTVFGKGVWTVTGSRSTITFTPDATFAGQTEPIGYMTTDSFGRTTDQPYQIQVYVSKPAKPQVTFNGSRRIAYGETATFTPTGRGKKIDYSTACLVDPVAPHDCVKTLEVAGQGTWTVDGSGNVTFVPVVGVTGNITPIEYQVTSLFGPPGLCRDKGAGSNGKYDNSDFYDNPVTRSAGTHSCSQTGSSWLVIQYSAATAPKIFRTVVTTDFQTDIFFTPKIHTSRGMSVINASACLIDPADNVCKTTVVIAGRGTFTVDTTNRSVHFVPEATFAGVTPGLLYRTQDTSGQTGQNWIRVTVNLPDYAVVFDTYKSTPFQTPITFMPNYMAVNPQFSTACLIDPADLVCKTEVSLINQGVYTVNQVNGEVTFTPLDTFVGVVTPIAYQIVDGFGWQGDGCYGGNYAKCYDTTDTCNKLDRGDHNAMFGDDCNYTIGGQHDNDLNNGQRDRFGEYEDFCTPGYGDGDGEDDDHGYDGDHYGHDTSDPYGYSDVTQIASIKHDSLDDDGHEDGEYDEDENIDEGDDEGSHYCKNLITSWLFMTVTSDSGIEAFPYQNTTPYQTALTDFRPTANVTVGNADIDWSTLCFIDPATQGCVYSIDLPGYGTYTSDPGSGYFTFTPEPFFSGSVPTVYYQVCDTLYSTVGVDEKPLHCAQSSIKLMVADPDSPVGQPTHKFTDYETPITFTPNVSGTNLLNATACIVDPLDSVCKSEVVFDGQGTYSVDFATGQVTFVPAEGFWGDAPHVVYRIVDGFGLIGDYSRNQCLLQDPYKFLLEGGSGSYEGSDDGTYNCFRVVESNVYVTVAPPEGPVAEYVSAKTSMETPVTKPLSYNGLNIDPTQVCLIKVVNNVETDCVGSLFLAGYGSFELGVNGDGVATVTFTPVAGFYGEVPAVGYRVFDELGRTDENIIKITVEKALPPEVDPYTETIDHNTSTSFTPNVTGGHIIDYASACFVQLIEGTEQCIPGFPLSIDGQGRFEINDLGVVTFYADYGFAGAVDTVTYRIFDDLGQSAENTINITVNTPPLKVYNTEDTIAYDTNWVASPIEWDGTAANNPGVVMQYEGIFVAVKDACFLLSDNTCVKTLTNDAEGTWTIDTNGKVTFNPLASFADDYTSKVHYQLCDDFEQCETGYIKLFVTKPLPPVVDDLDDTTPYQTTKEGMLPEYDGGTADLESACVYTPGSDESDASNCVNTVTVDEGTWTVNADGTVDFDPADEFVGEVTITYEICDLWGQCDKATITLTVEKPAAPTIENLTDEVEFNEPWTGKPEIIEPTDGTFTGPLDYSTACLKVTINDVEDCVTSYTDEYGNLWEVDEEGNVDFTPDPDFAGDAPQITYCVEDIFSQEGCGTIDIKVGKPAAPSLTALVDETPYDTNWTAKTELDGNDQLVCDPATAGYSCARPVVEGTNIDFSTACFIDPVDSTKCEKELVIEGEGTFTIDANGDVTFNPLPTFANSTTSCALYRVSDIYDQSGSACVTIFVVKPAPRTIDPFSGETPYVTPSDPLLPEGIDPVNDPTLDPESPCIKFVKNVEGVETTVCEKEFVDDKGNKWLIDDETGGIVLDPSSKTTGETGPVTYCVTDIWGQEACAEVKVEVGLPIAPTAGAAYDNVAYKSSKYLYPTQQYVDPKDPTKFLPQLTNGSGDFISFCFLINDICLTNNGETVYEYDNGEGVWTLNPTTGAVLFEANDSFYGRESELIKIRVEDEFGFVTFETVQVFVENPVTPLEVTYNTTGYMQAVNFTPKALNANTGLADADWEQFLDRTTACVVDPSKVAGDVGYCTKYLEIANVGIWEVNAVTGEVTFTPSSNFAANSPEQTSIEYRVTDTFGEYAQATQYVGVSAQPLSQLNGIVWLDMNKNGVQDPGEPGLPGIQVTAAAVNTQGAIFKPVRTQRAGSTSRVLTIASVETYTATTTKTGAYSFTVKPAAYKLSAILNTSKISKTSEGDSGYIPPTSGDPAEWSLDVPTLEPGATEEVNFGAAGTGSMTGSVLINGTAPIPNATVTCRWAGLDGILGNDDDLDVIGTADSKGQFTFEGIPGGDFQCIGKDTQGSGQESSPVRASVDQYSGKPATVKLPLKKVSKYVFTVSGFPAGRPTFTKSMIRRFKSEIARHPGAVRASIDGFTQGPTILQVDHKLSLDRARAAWTLLQQQDNMIKLVGYRGIQDYQLLGKKIRRVTVTLYFY